jgi:uncharacterized protein (TIGR00297 family)
LVTHRFGGKGAALLGLFFTSGSGLSRLPGAKARSAGNLARTERQVVANGGVAALAAIGSYRINHSLAVVALAGSLAAATSDTWATEIGLQSGQKPRYLISGDLVAPGMSGGITPAGTLASVAGALAISAFAGVLYGNPRFVPVVFSAGMTGSIVDSALGELVQVKRRSNTTGGLTERVHDGSQPTSYAAGWRWVDNDLVNLACTLTGGLVAFALWRLTAPDRR